jgi:PhzF family phenazine biosynthesis protein
MATGSLHRLAAFTTVPTGGNPAGVWIGERLPDPETMQRIAADVGYSETAFVAPRTGLVRTIRYYSPESEVSFCGHATIAAGAVFGEVEGDGTFRLSTPIGLVEVSVRNCGEYREASLISVEPKSMPATDALVVEALSALGWSTSDLDNSIPPAKAFAGAWHLVIAVATAHRLAKLNYDFERLKTIMHREGLITLQLVWRSSDNSFHSRNPFPVGGFVEDPATGAAAAALGGYLRDAGLIIPPQRMIIHQGEAIGRPSQIVIDIPASGGIKVTGAAVRIASNKD